MNGFFCPTAIVTGAAGQALARIKPGRLLLVADPFFVENGTAQRLLEESGAKETKLLQDVKPDPTVEMAARGTAEVRSFMPDTVAALGGGSAIDLAKAMVYFSGLQVHFAAIPTTSGSGSEVTDFSILTHAGVKHPLVDEKLRPNTAILDGALLEKLPKGLIADTGFDVLSHALEAWVATSAGAITDALAKDAFSTAAELLPASYEGDTRVRLGLHMASCMAGMAFSGAGLGLCHGMAHALGGMFHVSHGRLNAVLLPAVIGANSPAAGKKYAALARAAGVGGAADALAVRNLKNALVRLRRNLGLPATLQEAGIDLKQLRQHRESLIGAVLQDPCCATNPVPVTAQLVADVLDEVAGHG